MAKIVVIGGASWDTIHHVGNFSFTREQSVFPHKTIHGSGSTGVGKAIPLAQLGHEVTLYIALGRDEHRDKILNELSTYSIEVIVEDDPLGTLTHTNLMNNDGERVSIFTNPGSQEVPLIHQEIVKSRIDSADIIVLNILPFSKPLFNHIKQSRKPVFVDLHDYDGTNPYHNDFIEVASHLQLAKSLFDYPQVWIENMVKTKEMVILTDGPRDAFIYTSLKSISMTPKPVQLRDANGAGDHISAGVIHGILSNQSLETQLRWGLACAKKCIESDSIASDDLTELWLEKQ